MQRWRCDLSAALVAAGPSAGRVGCSSKLADTSLSPVESLCIRSVDERLHGFYRRIPATLGKREMEIQDDRSKRQELGKEQELDVDWL